jgi:hypothetical protein
MSEIEEEINLIYIEKMLDCNKFHTISFPLLTSAIKQYQSSDKNNLLLSESHYYSLYESLRDDENDWFIYFDEGNNTYLHAELFCKILDMLVTIYRIRSNLEMCTLILSIYEKLLHRYNEIIIANSILNKDELIIKSMTAVNYKFNINIINCWMENSDKADIHGDKIIPYLRKTILYELKRNDIIGVSNYLSTKSLLIYLSI